MNGAVWRCIFHIKSMVRILTRITRITRISGDCMDFSLSKIYDHKLVYSSKILVIRVIRVFRVENVIVPTLIIIVHRCTTKGSVINRSSPEAERY